MTQAQGAPVELKNVSKSYGEVAAVDQVSLSVGASEFVTLLGPSGSGKTTSLMMIAGFEQPDRGDVIIGGRQVTNLPAYRRDLGFVFQHYALFPHMTVYENLAFPLTTRGMPHSEIVRRVPSALERVRLPGLEKRYPSQLSGGQQQRVALARALIFDAPVLLMDEPLGALDKKLREQMQVEIKRIQRDLHVTVVYVTHDQEEALAMSDRIAVMNGGRIVQFDSPERIYEQPDDPFVADFIGQTNLLTAAVARAADGLCELVVSDQRIYMADALEKSGLSMVIVALRPERISIRPADGLHLLGEPSKTEPHWRPAVVEEVMYLGNLRKYRVRSGGLSLTAHQQVNRDAPMFGEGQNVTVGWYPQDVKLLRTEA